MIPPARAAAVWIGSFIGLAGALAFLYPDSYQQDGGYHFLFARWAWTHPDLFVDVWSRPAFTALYFLPAQIGYPAAKLFTVLICAACAWQTWRLAGDLQLSRSALAIPLLIFQPTFLLISFETMTEPLFALILVVALRLHYGGRLLAAGIVASLLVLARPEGAIVIAVWAVWILRDRRDLRHRLLALPGLAAGAAIWWLAALLITGDPLFIPRSWPQNWTGFDALYGSGSALGYAARLPEIVGPLLAVPFVIGAYLTFRRGPRGCAVLVATIFLLHSVLWSIGGLGTAGYPRYMVTVAPATAILTLVGWNAMADRFAARAWGGRVVLAMSGLFAVYYVDCWAASRDARVIDEAHAAWSADPRPVNRFVWSHAYMAIRFDDDPRRAPRWGDRETNLRLVKELPPGTLVFWDFRFGPEWYHLADADFQHAGFDRVRSQSYELKGRFGGPWWLPSGAARHQEIHLLYKR